jgi:hypothetical protein
MNFSQIPSQFRQRLSDLGLGLRSIGRQLLAPRVLIELHDRSLLVKALGRQARQTIEVPLPQGVCRQGEPLEVEALGDLMGDLLLDQGLAGARISAALPLQACRWKLIQWPLEAVPDDPCEALRLIDPDLDLPCSLAEAYLDLQVLPGLPPRCLVVAAPRRVVDGWAKVFDVAGVQLQRLEPAQVCEWRHVRQRLAPAKSNPEGDTSGDTETDHWLLELQADHCRLWLLEDGLPLADWRLPGNRNNQGLDPRLAAELERRRRFWNQQRQQQQRQQQQQLHNLQPDWQQPGPESATRPGRDSRWWLYGDPDLLTRLETPLAELLGRATVQRLEQPKLADGLGIRLSGLKQGAGGR